MATYVINVGKYLVDMWNVCLRISLEFHWSLNKTQLVAIAQWSLHVLSPACVTGCILLNADRDKVWCMVCSLRNALGIVIRRKEQKRSRIEQRKKQSSDTSLTAQPFPWGAQENICTHQSYLTLSQNGWAFIPLSWPVIRSRATLRRSALGEAALCSWDDPWRGWELKNILPLTLCFPHLLAFHPNSAKGHVTLHCITMNRFIIELMAKFKYVFFLFFYLASFNLSFMRALTLSVLFTELFPHSSGWALNTFIEWINPQLSLLIALIYFMSLLTFCIPDWSNFTRTIIKATTITEICQISLLFLGELFLVYFTIMSFVT